MRRKDARWASLPRAARSESTTLPNARRCSWEWRAPGNRNALQYGFYTADAIAERRRLNLLLRRSRATLEQLKG